MRETKLIIVLRALDTIEIKAFDKFVQSPYFNTSDTIIKLWGHLKKYAPDFESALLDKEKTYKKIFPKEVFNDKKLRQLRSRLFKLVEEFLVVEHVKKEKDAFDEKLAQSYYDKGLFENSENIYQKIITQIPSSPYPSIHTARKKMLLHHQLYFSQFSNNKDQYPIDLEKVTQYLETFYWQQKLFYAIEWFSRNSRYQEGMPLSIETLQNVILQNQLVIPKKNKAIELYILFCKKYLTKDEAVTNQLFFNIKNEITANYQGISDYDKHWMIKQLINYAVKQLNYNNSIGEKINWEKEIFDLYRLGLSDNSLLHKGKMTEISFMNIVYQACRLKEFEWVKQFLKNVTHNLTSSHPAHYIILAESFVAFFQGKFEECLLLNSNISLKDSIIVEINRRNLQIRAAFECYLVNPTYQPILFSFIRSHNKYLGRNTSISTQKKQAHLNLNLAIKKLANWLERSCDINKLEDLKKELNSFKFFSAAAKEWLMNHIHNFEKGSIPKDTPKRLIKY